MRVLQHASFTPEAISERNTEKNKALRSYFYVFLLFSLQGIHPKTPQTYRIQVFARSLGWRRAAAPHAFIHVFAKHILCANTAPCHPAPSNLEVRRCRQKCKRNSPPVGFFSLLSCSTLHTSENFQFHLHARNAALIAKNQANLCPEKEKEKVNREQIKLSRMGCNLLVAGTWTVKCSSHFGESLSELL